MSHSFNSNTSSDTVRMTLLIKSVCLGSDSNTERNEQKSTSQRNQFTMERGGCSRQQKPGMRYRRRPRRPKENKQKPVMNITKVLRKQMTGGSRLRWTHLPQDFFIARAKEGSAELHETLTNIFKYLDEIETVSTNNLPLEEIRFDSLFERLANLQEQVHTFQRLSQEDESLKLTCADILYYFGLVRSLTNIIRRPARHFSLDEMLSINANIEELKASNQYPWWHDYFQFVKKAFEILHYVFNWVDQSSNIIVNDDQFIHYLFVLIPVKGM